MNMADLLSSVIVHDFNMARPGLTVRPLETDVPLLIDANKVLPGTISSKRFEPVSGQGAQRTERQRRIQD
ncbi:MAG: hypothetical protein K0S36_2249 [Nitrosospira multiformis]|nr:hypothetical protein [Nitrosospira multiformis]